MTLAAPRLLALAWRPAAAVVGLALTLPALSCTKEADSLQQLSTFRVEVVAVNDTAPPTPDAPLPANRGDVEEVWDVTIQAISPTGEPEPFDGVVRVRVEPGAIVDVENLSGADDGAIGRNIRLTGGAATARVRLTAVYGDARLWVEDIGYLPAAPGATPACANGENDDSDDDVLVDFPNDPGCAFANDDTEEGGTFAAGVSPPVRYALPRLIDIQGESSTTPYPFEGMEVSARDPQFLVVTRIARDGFYVTDLGNQAEGYNHIFAFNFSTPQGMRVCDRVLGLSGTVVEFFGFTELSFPSYVVEQLPDDQLASCPVPEPIVLEDAVIDSADSMERVESALVRLGSVDEAGMLVDGFTIAQFFGSKPAKSGQFGPDQSNCDINGDGEIDFENNPEENACAQICAADPRCTEWTGYSSRGNYKVSRGTTMIQINTQGAPGFVPTDHKGEVLPMVTGTLRNFSGGDLNWTVEARCIDDVLCGTTEGGVDWVGCSKEIVPTNEACVRDKTLGDNDEASN